LQKQYKNRKCKYQLKVKIEKAYRLGKERDDMLKPRPVVVELTKFSDRELIRTVSKRFRGTQFGISPQYPKEAFDRRKKLIPIMMKERSNKNNAYLVGDNYI
jgi:hypothetical protein